MFLITDFLFLLLLTFSLFFCKLKDAKQAIQSLLVHKIRHSLADLNTYFLRRRGNFAPRRGQRSCFFFLLVQSFINPIDIQHCFLYVQADKDSSPASNRNDDFSFRPCFALCRCSLRPTFFFDGIIRLTEGETLNCSEPGNYDEITKGRFFGIPKLRGLGEIHFFKLHTPYLVEGKVKEVANEIALAEDVKRGERKIIYVNNSLKYRGFELYRNKEGYSPLFVLRDKDGRVVRGSYVPLQSIRQEDGTFLYRSGNIDAPGSFPFPQDQEIAPVFRLQTTYYPDKNKKRAGEVLFRVWKHDPSNPFNPGSSFYGQPELFKGKAALREKVKVGDYFLSMDEVRYWTSMNVNYRPGLAIIFSSFWVICVGVILTTVIKTAKGMGDKKHGG